METASGGYMPLLYRVSSFSAVRQGETIKITAQIDLRTYQTTVSLPLQKESGTMKLKGTLLSSALLMLVLVTAVFYAQLLGHQLQQATYQRQSMYYRARTLAVLAQKLDLKPGQKASSAQGQVEMLKDQVKVFLPNGQKYTLDQIN